MIFELVFNSKLAKGNGIRHICSGRKSSTSVCRSVDVKIYYEFFWQILLHDWFWVNSDGYGHPIQVHFSWGDWQIWGTYKRRA